MSDPKSAAETGSQKSDGNLNSQRSDTRKPPNLDLELLNFQGLSLAEMSEQLSSIDSGSPPPDDPLNTSDFFNSRGELILSGISEWSSDSDREVDDDLIPREANQVKRDDNDGEVSDGSTASTESITAYEPSTWSTVTGGNIPPLDLDSSPAVRRVGEPRPDPDPDVIKTPKTPNSQGEDDVVKVKPKNKTVRFGHSNVDFGGEMVTEIPNKSSGNGVPSEEYYWSEPVKDEESFRAVIHNVRDQDSFRAAVQNIKDEEAFRSLVQNFNSGESFQSGSRSASAVHNVPNYGVRVYPGLQGLNVMNNSKTSGWRILPGTENSEQIMCRAPNFRTPGGYKPPLEEKPPRNLTSAEITEEVRQMYAEDAERDFESQIIPTVPSASSTPDDKVDNFVKRKPPVKRKLFKPETEADDEKSSGDPPPGELSEVVEAPCVKGRSFVCGGEGDFCGSGSGVKSSSSESNSVLDMQFTGDISRCLPRQHRNKNRGVDLNSPAPSFVAGPGQESRKSNLAALDKLWRDIQETKQHMEADMRSRMKAQDLPIERFSPRPDVTFQSTPELPDAFNPDLRPTGSDTADPSVSKSVTNPVVKRTAPIASKVQRHLRRGGKQMPRGQTRSSGKGRSPRQKVNPKIDLGADLDPSDLDSLELSAILREAQLDESDLDDILREISEFPTPGLLFDESEAPEELTSALQQLQITDWAKAGASEYVDKFHEEKYKRQQCEKEILQVQKELLEQRERIAVLEGLLKSKEAAVTKSTNLWEALVRKWKSHETKCKKTIAGLEAEQKELKSELESRKTRLVEYETEMGKAVSVTEEFKVKNEGLVQEMLDNQAAAGLDRKHIQDENVKLMMQLEERKVEKESSLRALQECQENLDEMKSSLEAANKKLLESEKQSGYTEKILGDLSRENEKLRRSTNELEKDKGSLQSELDDATENLKTEKAQKELLEASVKTRLNEEVANLHKYYNDKLHEKLTAVSTKVITAEKEMQNIHAKQLSDMEKASKARIAEVESKFQCQFETLKRKYDSEMANLRRENFEKGKLIGAVSRQLQSFESGSRVLDISNSNFDEPSKPATVTKTKLKTHSHGQKMSTTTVIPAIQRGMPDQPGTQVLVHSTTAMATAQHLENPTLTTASADVQNCIAALVNAYKQKNWPSNQNQN